jgi:hypothetical protein
MSRGSGHTLIRDSIKTRRVMSKTGSALSDVPAEKAFYFYTDVGVYADRCASNVASFYDVLGGIDIRSVEFHMSRGDFEKWIRSLGDDALARNLAKLRKKGLGGEDLRARLRDTVGKRLGKR